MKILYLVPDTNLFLQCKPLDQIAWTALGDWDQIEVLLTRPVQSEIDALKGKGNGRQASRARRASSLIRELLKAEGERLELQRKPLVHLYLRQDLRRDESASEDLDYDERDDQLVGTALGFQKANAEVAVWLLTNDTGPMASAKAVGLQYRELPDEWLLPPEADASEKRESALKEEIAHYKSQEPSFLVELSAIPEDRQPFSVTIFESLSAKELDALLSRLSARFPLCNYFGPSEAKERILDRDARSILFGQTKEFFKPATQDEIQKYIKAYEKWIQECTKKLSHLPSTLHKRLSWPKLSMKVQNVGSRPADDALVVLSVKGDVFLRPPKRKEDDEEKENDYQESLSPAPSAPQGRWERMDPWSISDSIARLVSTVNLKNEDFLRPFLHNTPQQRDPNALYFKEGERGRPSKHIEYECAQWRHAQPAEEFQMDVVCPFKPGIYSALVSAEVHAANLTHPKVVQLPIKILVEESSCLEIAQEMVAALGA